MREARLAAPFDRKVAPGLRRLRGATANGAALLILLAGPALAAPAGPIQAGALESRALAAGAHADAVDVLFVGFRAKPDHSALVYVELSRSAPVSVESQGNKVVYTLSNTQVRVKNNQRALLTGAFPTQLVRASLVPHKKDTRLVLELRAPAETKHQLVERDGVSVLEVEVPAP